MKKIALIIGGSSGIGLAVAKKLLKNDYIVYNGSRNICPETAVNSIFLDVNQPNAIKDAVDKIVETHNQVDLLVYSAGYSMAAPIEYVKSEDYRYLYDVNLFGAIEAVKAVVPFMRENGVGQIIFISSLGSTIPIAFDPYYSSSKAALDMLCLTLRLELQKYNIRLTSLLPGGTKTAFSYKRNIYTNNEPYEIDLQSAVNVLYEMEQKGMEAEAVAKTIFRVIKRKNPPPIIAAGLVNKLFLLTERLLPRKVFLWVVGVVFGRG